MGRRPGRGANPGMPSSVRRPLSSGMACSRRRVYGWLAPANSSAAGPISTSRPAYMTAMRSASSATTARSCVTYTAAAWCALVRSRIVSSTCACVVTSRPVVGSSSTMILGRQANAMARATRCCWPPESWCGYRRRNSLSLGSSTSAIISAMRAWRSSSLLPKSCTSRISRELQADAQRGVERRAGVLRHVADHAAAQLAELPGAQREHVLVVDGDAAAADLGAAALEVEQRRGGRGLAGGGLADEAEHLALDELEVDLVVDLDARGVERDLQVLDGEDDLAHLRPPCPARCRSWRERCRRWRGSRRW